MNTRVWWLIAAGAAIVSTLVIVLLSTLRGETLGGSEVEELWNSGFYAKIADTKRPGDDSVPMWIAAKFKVGDYQGATAQVQMEATSPDGKPERLLELNKALILRSKGDLQGSDKVMSQLSEQDDLIGSLVAAVRAQWMCDQKLWDDCKRLAQESIERDQLAPYGMILNAQVLRLYRDFKAAAALYKRAAGLGGIENLSVRLNRGVTSFYMVDLSGAIDDLRHVVDDPIDGYGAKIFLGRAYLDSGQYALARDAFQKAFDEKGTEKRDGALWLGRVEMRQRNRTGALEQYYKGYDRFPTALELVTDMLVPAARVGNTELLQKLEDTVRTEVKASFAAYDMAGKKLREAGEYAVGKSLLEQGLIYASGAIQMKQLKTQLQFTLFAQAFATMQEGRSIYPMIAELQKLDADADQIAFVQAMAVLRAKQPASAATLFAKIPTLKNKQDQAYAWVRYNIFVGNIQMAQEVMRALQPASREGDQEINGESGSVITGDAKLLRLNRAVATVQNHPDEANKYIDVLRAGGLLDDPEGATPSEKERWTQAFASFKPWAAWMMNFFDEENL